MAGQGGIDYSEWQFWLNVAQVGGYVVLGLYVWFTNRQKATVAEIREVKDNVEALKAAQALRCGEHITRTTTLEVALKSAPTHADIGEVYDRVNVVKGTVDEMSGVLKGVNSQVRLLVEHHMKGDGR